MDDFKQKVRLSAHQEGDKTVIYINSDEAQFIIKHEKGGEEMVMAIIDNMDRILEYMWNDYLIRRQFSQQLDNELEKWLESD